jgi:hypothetical protein
MKPRWVTTLIIAVNIIVFGIFIFLYAYLDYPFVGHDFRLFISRLLDTHLHYTVEGFSIQWYTPSFGGGLPAYANPLQAQFSLPQLLTWFIDPFNAVLLSSVIYAFLGFLGVFFFLKGALSLSRWASILGGMLFIGNGFFIERVVIGHVNFITFPLISVYVLAFLHPKFPLWLSGVLIALTTSLLVYSGGVYIGVIGFFSVLIIFPTIYLVKPSLFSFRKILFILLIGGVLTLLISGSKLNATSIYMANFPRLVRDEYKVNWVTGLGGMIFQLIGVMTTTPFLAVLGKSPLVLVGRLSEWTGTPYSFWEMDSSISPVLIWLLGLGAWIILRKKPSIYYSKKKLIAGGFLFFAIIITAQFAMAKGFLFTGLSALPILNSLHANIRFTAAFILPFAILGAKVFETWVKSISINTHIILRFVLLDIAILSSLWIYFLLPSEVQLRNYQLDISLNTYQKIRAGETMPVETIIPDMNDYEVFLAGASNTARHYEPLFRDKNEAFHPLVIEGSVLLLEDGYFNMTNPTGYLFPQENGTIIYQRFRESEYGIMKEFLSRHQPNWDISTLQKVANWSALITILLICVGSLIYCVLILTTRVKTKIGTHQ